MILKKNLKPNQCIGFALDIWGTSGRFAGTLPCVLILVALNASFQGLFLSFPPSHVWGKSTFHSLVL